MDYTRSQIPAFGRWDFTDAFPITQCFESAAQAGYIRFNDVSVESDLYGYDLKRFPADQISPVKIKGTPKHYEDLYEKQGRVYCDLTEPVRQSRAHKAVDADLYKIPPELLHQKPKREKMMGFWWRCLAPSCIG